MIDFIRCPVCGANHDNPEYEAPSFKRTQSMKDFCPVCIRTVGNTWRGDCRVKLRELLAMLPLNFDAWISRSNVCYIATISVFGEVATRDDIEFLKNIAEDVCSDYCGPTSNEFDEKYDTDTWHFRIEEKTEHQVIQIYDLVSKAPTEEHVNQFLINRVRQYAKANPVRKFRLSMTSKDTVMHRRTQDLGLKPNALITLKKNPTMQELLNACINVASENIQLREAIQNVAD